MCAARSMSIRCCCRPIWSRRCFRSPAPTSSSTWRRRRLTSNSCTRSFPTSRRASCTRWWVCRSRARPFSTATSCITFGTPATRSRSPGIKGLVMTVFTLPSYPYVFKVIRDLIAQPKDTDREQVMAKYRLVKIHDRVGRMSDTWEYSLVALPRKRFSAELIRELLTYCPSVVEIDDQTVLIKHVYIERRMTPLNIFLLHATDAEVDRAIREYGQAIKDLAAANIFPGDMLFKNFGVTRLNRVVFYDYDEIEYMVDCNFRPIPEAPNEEAELSVEPWYPVGPRDVFPEQFGPFLLGDPRIRAALLKYHADLLTPEFWQRRKERILQGVLEDIFPYSEERRFVNRYRCRVAEPRDNMAPLSQ